MDEDEAHPVIGLSAKLASTTWSSSERSVVTLGLWLACILMTCFTRANHLPKEIASNLRMLRNCVDRDFNET